MIARNAAPRRRELRTTTDERCVVVASQTQSLALVARLCRQHGGAVTLEESELGGACFIAVLDRSLCAEAATEPAP